MRRGDTRVLLIDAALLVAIGLLDYLTPSDVEFTLFYMIPVVLTAWVLGWRVGLAVGLAVATIQFGLDDVLRNVPPATALWNGLSRLGVFFALAYATDKFHLERIAKEQAYQQERQRWAARDADRNALERMLIHELQRPLRALDWFARTFEERLVRDANAAAHAHFRAFRQQIREATFLGTDLLALGRLDEKAHFERRRVDLAHLLTEAAEESPARTRILLSLTNQPLGVVADPDRLRHAFASLIDRAAELSPHDDVTVLARLSADEAAVEINSRTRELTEADVELPRLLVEGNGGRLLLISRGVLRGSLVTVHLPLDPDAGKLKATGEAENTLAE
jgi:signal transduction histidine kinase